MSFYSFSIFHLQVYDVCCALTSSGCFLFRRGHICPECLRIRRQIQAICLSLVSQFEEGRTLLGFENCLNTGICCSLDLRRCFAEVVWWKRFCPMSWSANTDMPDYKYSTKTLSAVAAKFWRWTRREPQLWVYLLNKWTTVCVVALCMRSTMPRSESDQPINRNSVVQQSLQEGKRMYDAQMSVHQQKYQTFKWASCALESRMELTVNFTLLS